MRDFIYDEDINSIKQYLKIDFNFENYEVHPYEECIYNNILGDRKMKEFEFCGCCAGGDWEYPVYFIVYERNGKLKAYCPKMGNIYNKLTKQAFGNDDEEDVRFLKKWFNKHNESKLHLLENIKQYYENDVIMDVCTEIFDESLILFDIQQRFCKEKI